MSLWWPWPHSPHSVFQLVQFFFRLPPSRCRNLKAAFQYQCFSCHFLQGRYRVLWPIASSPKTDTNGKSISFKLLIQLQRGGQKVSALVLILPCTFNTEISDGFQDVILLPLKLYSRPQMNWQSLVQHLDIVPVKEQVANFRRSPTSNTVYI